MNENENDTEYFNNLHRTENFGTIETYISHNEAKEYGVNIDYNEDYNED